MFTIERSESHAAIAELTRGQYHSFTASTFSAFASRLSFRLDRLYTEEENAISALSRIEDVDIAKEMIEFVKESILAQTALAIGAQANALPEHVLTLIDTLPDTSIR